MKKFRFVFLLLVLLAPHALSQRSLNTRAPVIRRDVILTLSDGYQLDCSAFYPNAPRPKTGWPCMVYLHGYADSKDVMLADAEAQAAYGYYTFTYSMRGQGVSEGRSNLISRREMSDLIEVVEQLKQDSLLNPKRIALFGGSQGGILPFMAACNGLNVRCIIADLASPEFATSWIENGCVKITLFFTVDYDSATVRYEDEVKNIRRWILSKQTIHWDSLETTLRNNRDFPDQVSRCSVPILFTNAWEDRFFSTNGIIKTQAALRNRFKMYMGAVNGHGADSSNRESKFISALDNAWLEYWLNNIPSPLIDSVNYFYASSHYPSIQQNWSYSRFSTPVWPPSEITNVRFYLRDDSSLTQAPPTANASTKFTNDVRDPSLTMQQAIDAAFTGAAFNLRFGKRSLVFDSEPLSKNLHAVGIPKLKLGYSSTADVCQYNFQIWEVRPGGTANLVSRINYTDRHYIPLQLRDTLIDGIAFSHLFLKGNRLRIVVTNLDTQPADSFLTTNPHVLPVLKRAENTILLGPAHATYLDLPVMDYAITEVSERMHGPDGVAITSMYPQPASRQTTIGFSLGREEHVSIEVFDLLGRVAVPRVSREYSAGDHRLTLDTSFLRNGMYLARVTTQSASAVQRVVVVQ